MLDASLSSRIAVISGASSGIGEAVARSLSSLGAAVVLNARRRERLAAVADSLRSTGARIALAPGDAADPRVVDSMLDEARRAFGAEADLIVINAGRGLAGSVLGSDPTQWEEMIRTNILAASLLLRAAAKRLIESRAAEGPPEAPPKRPRDIVILGSNVGRHISPFSSMYGSTKFAVGALAESARRELAPKGIRVTHIAPGVVKSEFQSVAGYDPKGFGEFMDRIGPVLDPADVARLIAFIVSQPPHVHVNDVVIRPTRQEYP